MYYIFKFFKTFYLSIIGGGVFFLGCSTQTDALPNRLYHQLNTKYNGLFYAEQYLYEGIEKIEKSHSDNYKEILRINKYGDLKSAQSAQSSLDRAIEKSTMAIQKHSMEIEGEERNRLIDYNYMIIGLSQFYKQEYAVATNTFNYLLRKSLDPEKQTDALIWATRCQQELGNKEAIRKNIILLEEDYYLNREQDAVLDEIQAENAIQDEYYAEAKHQLLKAIKKSKDKNKKTRMYFVLGQLNLLLNEPEEALHQFDQVIKKNPEYEFVFHAKLNRAKTYVPNKMNFQDLKKSLEEMLEDMKNTEYKDQIYYTLGNLQLKNSDTISAIKSLELSAEHGWNNNLQKLESHYLLANIFWRTKQYVYAYNHCDSAYKLANSKNPHYIDIKKMHRSVKKIATQYNIINYNDSIITLARLPESERNNIIDAYIEDLKKQDVENKSLSEDRGSNNTFNNYEHNRESQNSMNITSGGGWYFYNPSAMSLGYSGFLSRWGNRKLEDNWRRKNKDQIISEDDLENNELLAGPTEKEKYNREYYIRQLPMEEQEQLILLSKIEMAYYNLATVFKEDLEDYSESIKTYNQLLERFPSTNYRQIVYFDLYNIHTIEEDTINAINFLKKIEKEYPESNYLAILKGETSVTPELDYDKKTYNKAYELYTTFTQKSCMELGELFNTNKNNAFIAEIELLFVFCESKNTNKKTLVDKLKDIIKKHPKTQTASQADTLILILEGKLAFDNERFYQNEFESPHYFFLLINDISINLPETQLAISKFNITNYKLDSLETTNLLLTKELQLLKIGDFKNKDLAFVYYELIQENNITKEVFTNSKIKPLIISKNNYTKLLKEKNINQYIEYFNEIYLLN